MNLKLDDLYTEKALLQKDFDETRRNIAKVEQDLGTMKANLNALNGAIQQTNKLINMAESGGGNETPKGRGKKWKDLSLL